MWPVKLVAPERWHDEHLFGAKVLDQERKQEQRRAVRSVEIVDHQHQRALLGDIGDGLKGSVRRPLASR
jgi:hypothetical protein